MISYSYEWIIHKKFQIFDSITKDLEDEGSGFEVHFGRGDGMYPDMQSRGIAAIFSGVGAGVYFFILGGVGARVYFFILGGVGVRAGVYF